jgi:lipoprotein-anchoring transpeptidase ErfK/SrfK
VYGSPRLIRLALLGATALVLAACSSSGPSPAAKPKPNPKAIAKARATQQAAQAAADISVTPGSGQSVDPSAGLAVTMAHGKLTGVTVHSGGDPVTGTMSSDGMSWHSTWALNADTSYTVTADGKTSSGQPLSVTRTFRTLSPRQSFSTMIFEGEHETYGVGIPIMLTFSQPITNKAAVERSLELYTSKPVIGAWYWDGNEQLDFRPRDYWPANTTVSFVGHLNGIEGAPGVYGTHTLTQSFTIGQSMIAVASTSTHYTKIYIGGKLRYTWPISTGRPTLPTPDGTYLTVEKGNPVRMIGTQADYYNELVYYAVRFTYSGDYYHSAPWSVAEQGNTNVSHGCVNLPPSAAQIYYNMAVPGDPITITSSPKSGRWDDGWTEWFLSWDQYLAGSATHEAVEAGPSGSTFVSASSLPADTATAPLGTSASGNYRAS